MSETDAQTRRHLRGQELLWEMTARKGSGNPIAASGWFRAADRQPFSREEMAAAVDNVYEKLYEAYLASGEAHILEIGVGSGLVFRRLIECAQTYDVVDISSVVLDECRRVAVPASCRVEYFKRFAHEVESLPACYDLIIMNSVMQYFGALEYARTVLKVCRRKLNRNGALFCGDVMDAGKRTELEQYLSVQDGGASKQNHDRMLFYSRSFFQKEAEVAGFSRCVVSDKRCTFKNELSLFRFDVILYTDPCP